MGSREDLLDHGCLGIGIVLHIFPGVASKFSLGAFVEATIGFVAAQLVAKEQHAVDLTAAS